MQRKEGAPAALHRLKKSRPEMNRTQDEAVKRQSSLSLECKCSFDKGDFCHSGSFIESFVERVSDTTNTVPTTMMTKAIM